MKKIFKYELLVSDDNTLELPVERQILKIGLIGHQLFMWVMIPEEEDAVTEEVHILIIGTGWKFDDKNLVHLQTIQLKGFIWHIFEMKKEEN